MGEKEEILRSEGLIEGPNLPAEFAEFVESMSDEEVEVVVNLKRRADEAGIPTMPLRMSMPVL